MLSTSRSWGSRTAQQDLARVGRRAYAAVAELAKLPQVGERLHGFTVKRTKHVPELELTALHLEHDRTGAEYLHVARDDKNNVFSIGFKTNPPDCTGVPHILEHLALCGSEKYGFEVSFYRCRRLMCYRYPVRDPFFKMMPRSLSNFMNAMTYPDHTVYPFATTNHQDFKNLMSVYMDATLHPLLRYHDFAQEGWRLGPQNPTGPASDTDNPLQFKGVVYNEMKGSMSSADSVFAVRWLDSIFPELKNSGGDPRDMTSLTHDQLKKFHAEHYHPSNSKVFTYGNMPLGDHLQDIGPLLDRFESIEPDRTLKEPTSLSNGPKSVTVRGPVDPIFPKDQQYRASVSWLMCETSSILETFSLNMISSLLLEGFGAPLYQNTIEIGWGASYTSNTGLDTSGKIGIFSVGLNGLRKHDVGRLNGGLRNTLASVKRIGFDRSKIEGRLHQIELGLKHKTAHFGMGLMSRLQDGWFNGVDPLTTVAPEEVITAFKASLEQPDYLEELFEKYYLHDNTFTFVMEPAPEFEDELLAEEATRLSSKIADATARYTGADKAREELTKQEVALLEIQEDAKNADVSCLPTVRVSDINRHLERKEIRESSLGHTMIQWREAPTNGLTYFRALNTFTDLPDDLRIYLPLFSSAIQRLGSRGLLIEKLEDRIKLKTGGLSVGHHSSTSPLDLDICEDGIAFSGHALDRNVPEMFELLRLIIQDTDFAAKGAEEKIMELVKGAASNAINDIADSGSQYAQRFAEAGLSPQARLDEQVAGLTQVRLMMDLAKRSQRDGIPDVLEKLQAIQRFALSRSSSLRVALTCGAESSGANERALATFLERLPSDADARAPTASAQLPYPRDAKLLFPLPYQVYYSASALRTVPYTHAASAPLQILAELLTHKRLHPEVREKGGAYGAGAYASSLRGTFGFSTYRDPDPRRSLGVMREAGAWARAQQWSEREVEEAKLSVFQALDAPRSVSAEGLTRFLTGVDEAMQQARRERLLDVSAAQVAEVADRYVAQGADETRSVVVLGKQADWASEANGWEEMSMESGEIVDSTEDGYLTL